MLRAKILRITGLSVASAGLLAGFSGLAGASPHHYSGGSGTKSTATNSNVVGVTNNNPQNATTGNAVIVSKTDGHSHGDDGSSGTSGTATTGDASNGSTLKVSVDTSNSSTVPDPSGDHNDSSGTKSTATNTNTVTVTNNNNQNATSGKAVVVGSNNSGSATTGDASNTSNSTIDVTGSNTSD